MSKQRALALARAGWRPFPIGAGEDGKKPLIKAWQDVASSDVAEVERYWVGDAGAALATGEGFIVVDADVKPSRGDGLQTLAELGVDVDHPGTFAVRTPSGGMHLYYTTDETFRNTSDSLPGIDTRGEGGYVLAAGTRTPAGVYTVAHNLPLAPLPKRLRDAIYPRGPSTPAASVGRAGPATSLPGAEERAQLWLAQQRRVDSGRNHELFKRAAKIRNLGVCRVAAHVMLSEHVMERFGESDHELTEREISRTIDSAYDNAHSEFGRDARPVIDTTPPPAERIRWYAGTAATEHELPPRPWLTEGLTMRGVVSLLVAPGATSKSTWTLQYLIAHCLGGEPEMTANTAQALTGVERGRIRGSIKALLINNEDSHDELERRIEAICKHFALPREKLHGRLALSSGTTCEWRVATRDPETRQIAPGADLETLRVFIRTHSIDVVVFDPFVSFHDAAENSNDEMQRVVSQFRQLAADLHISVVLVHHTSKPPQASSDSYAGNINAGRGASAVKDAARVGVTMYTASAKDAETWEIPDERRHAYVRMDDAKQNLVLGSGEPTWFERRSVGLANGDSVGVLVATQLPRRPPKEKSAKRSREPRSDTDH